MWRRRIARAISLQRTRTTLRARAIPWSVRPSDPASRRHRAENAWLDGSFSVALAISEKNVAIWSSVCDGAARPSAAGFRGQGAAERITCTTTRSGAMAVASFSLHVPLQEEK